MKLDDLIQAREVLEDITSSQEARDGARDLLAVAGSIQRARNPRSRPRVKDLKKGLYRRGSTHWMPLNWSQASTKIYDGRSSATRRDRQKRKRKEDKK